MPTLAPPNFREKDHVQLPIRRDADGCRLLFPNRPRPATADVGEEADRAGHRDGCGKPQPGREQPGRLDCQGPFTFSFVRVQGAGAPNVYDFSIEFTGATNARDNGPGKCWRQRGWDFGPSLSNTRKGVLIYRVDLGKCPFVESLTMEGGTITKYKVTDRFMGSIWFDQAIRGGGPFTVDATFIGTTNSSAPVPYAVFVSPDTPTRVATCTP